MGNHNSKLQKLFDSQEKIETKISIETDITFSEEQFGPKNWIGIYKMMK